MLCLGSDPDVGLFSSGCEDEVSGDKVALCIDDREPISRQRHRSVIHRECNINATTLARAAPLPILGSVHELSFDRIALDVAAHSEKVKRVADSHRTKPRLIDGTLAHRFGSTSVPTGVRP